MERLLQLFIIRYHSNTFTKQEDNKIFYKKYHLGKNIHIERFSEKSGYYSCFSA